MNEAWYTIANISEIDTPALIIYKDRVEQNIRSLVQSIDKTERLRPHIKTHKSPHVTAMMLENGIRKFKCATIAEAEMLASAGATDILLAYQPVGPKAERFHELCLRFPQSAFACLIDNIITAEELSTAFSTYDNQAEVFIDLNVGMNRTGISPEDAFNLIQSLLKLEKIRIRGLHAYDGHLRDEDFAVRTERCNREFERVAALKEKVEKNTALKLVIVAGGTPTYSIHSKRKEVECSPGTFIYWDKGYEKILSEQHYLHAAVVATRIISKPAPGILCLDLGHKSIASENPLNNRVVFLNAAGVEPIGHSEEHMVLRCTNADNFHVGDVLYGVPFHVCPTIALYERSGVATDGKVSQWWETKSRNRKITV